MKHSNQHYIKHSLKKGSPSSNPLRQRMIEDMILHNLAKSTQENYVSGVRRLSRYYKRSPDKITGRNKCQANFSPIFYQSAMFAISLYLWYIKNMDYALKERIGKPGLFTGRKEELAYFLKWIDDIKEEISQSTALMARRKMGKTAILERLFNITFYKTTG